MVMMREKERECVCREQRVTRWRFCLLRMRDREREREREEHSARGKRGYIDEVKFQRAEGRSIRSTGLENQVSETWPLMDGG